jgi:hypothetical protein
MKSSAHQFKDFERLAVKYLAIHMPLAPSERIWSQAARVLTVKQKRMSGYFCYHVLQRK